MAVRGSILQTVLPGSELSVTVNQVLKGRVWMRDHVAHATSDQLVTTSSGQGNGSELGADVFITSLSLGQLLEAVRESVRWELTQALTCGTTVGATEGTSVTVEPPQSPGM